MQELVFLQMAVPDPFISATGNEHGFFPSGLTLTPPFRYLLQCVHISHINRTISHLISANQDQGQGQGQGREWSDDLRLRYWTEGGDGEVGSTGSLGDFHVEMQWGDTARSDHRKSWTRTLERARLCITRSAKSVEHEYINHECLLHTTHLST